MITPNPLPRILVIDDLFGRRHPDSRNQERANLCSLYNLEDITGDEIDKGPPQKIKNPIAQAVFHRGQEPSCSVVGNVVENDLEGTLKFVRDGWTEWRPERHRWALVLLDLCFYTGRVTHKNGRNGQGMPEGRSGDETPLQYFGLRLLKSIHDEFPELPVIILSSMEREDVSREFTQRGAKAFLIREDLHSPELLKVYLNDYGLVPDDTGEIVGHSKAVLQVLAWARQKANKRKNILIIGERGTGKELLARYLHRHSVISNERPYEVVDSGGLNEQLYASELFGHIRGAFPGAVSDRKGKIIEAHNGDLFLDEIGNMPQAVQNGLLRVIELGEVRPVGANKAEKVDVRFLSATNEDIESATGEFRKNLLDRLRAGGVLWLPPLRERIEDIEDLVKKFVWDAEKENPGAMSRSIEPEALARLRSYGWPGNIRELRNCIFNAVSSYPAVEHLVPEHLSIKEFAIRGIVFRNAFEVGTVLGDKWVILELLGRGGMGEVYRVHQLKLKREIAIKVILPKFLQEVADDEYQAQACIDRFYREVQVMAQVHHPNVVQIFDFGSIPVKQGEEEIQVEYIAMEYIPGGTLRSTMSVKGFYPEEDSMREWLSLYFLPLLDGVQALHGLGIVHRDLKPENVLLDGMSPKITDFGLARSCRLKPLTQSMDMMGTLPYMSPEHFQDLKRTDQRADVYALGKILYEAASGKITSNEIPFKQARLKDPETIFYQEIDRVIQDATVEDKNQRLASAAVLKEAIQEVLTAAGK